MNQTEKNIEKNSSLNNNWVTIPIGIIIASFLIYIFYINVELFLATIIIIISGFFASFLIRRYGTWGKMVAFFIAIPIFLIPKSVWKSIDDIEKEQKTED